MCCYNELVNRERKYCDYSLGVPIEDLDTEKLMLKVSHQVLNKGYATDNQMLEGQRGGCNDTSPMYEICTCFMGRQCAIKK